MLADSSRLLLILFIVSFLIRLGVVAQMSSHDICFQQPFVDELTNVDQARDFLDSGPSAGTPYWKPPGYPGVLALLGFPFDNLEARGLGARGQGVPIGFAWIVKIFQCLIDAGTTCLLAMLAGRWAGNRAALWAGLLHAVSWLSVYCCGQFLDTTLFTFLTVLSVDLLDRRWDSDPESSSPLELSWFFVGIVTGLASITRAVALPLAGVYALLALKKSWHSHRRWNSLSALLLGLFLSIGPVMALNRWAGEDQVIISSNGGVNLYIGNRAGGEIGADGLTSVAAGPRWDAVLELTQDLEKPSARSRAYVRLAVEEILSQPGAWLQRMGIKALALISARDVPNNKNLIAEEERNLGLKILRYGPGTSGFLVALLLFGVWKTRRELLQRGLPIIATIVLLALLTWIFFVAGRYRVPILALGCVFGGIGLARSTLQWRDFAPLLFISLLIHLIPIPSRTLMETYCIDPMALGYIHEQRGEVDLAEEWYQRCLREDPSDYRAHHNIGHLAQNRGDFIAAQLKFEEAVRANPNYAPSWNSLGTLLATADGPRALAAVRKAVEVDPSYTNAWINLGQLLESQQMYPGALDAYQRARRLESENPLAILLEARVRLARNERSQARRLLLKLEEASLVPGLQELQQRLKERLQTLESPPPAEVISPLQDSAEGED
ncbi:MAG: hypothetical protein CBC13_06900 [Planctomycetia bacterium TMED53]|nr:MAG: hypothetical protein CBC13_06900 [Planctomycetia bacterium TMED53]